MANWIRETASSSPWTDRARLPSYPALARDLTAAVVVVGAGITGLTAAWLLARDGVDVAVLEAGDVAGGASGDSTGHLTTCLDTDYHTLLSAHGLSVARAMAEASTSAIDFIEASVRRLGVACGFERVPGFLYAEQPLELVGLADETTAVAEVGLRAQLVHEVPLPFPVAGALRFEGQAQLDPRAYLVALAQAVEDAGGQVLGRTRVTQVEDGAPCQLEAGGHDVRAGAVLLATHTPIGRAMSLHTRLEPRTTYALSARVDAAPVGLYWDRRQPHHYVRMAGGLLLVGGGDHRTGEVRDTRECFRSLEAWTRAHFAVRAIEHRWSNQVFAPVDGLPFVGLLHEHEHVYAGTGYAGNGLTLGTIAGVLLAGLVTGRDTDLTQLLSPARVHAVNASTKTSVVTSLVDAPWRWVAARLRGADAYRIVDLPADVGQVIEIDGQRAAVYRDSERQLHFLSPVCTHAGCTVGWNQAQKTWDCPCHGGRYDPFGVVLCAPPSRDLDGCTARTADVPAHDLATSPTG